MALATSAWQGVCIQAMDSQQYKADIDEDNRHGRAEYIINDPKDKSREPLSRRAVRSLIGKPYPEVVAKFSKKRRPLGVAKAITRYCDTLPTSLQTCRPHDDGRYERMMKARDHDASLLFTLDAREDHYNISDGV